MRKSSVIAIFGGLSFAILGVALLWAASFLFERYRQYQQNEQIAQIERAEDDALKLAVRSAQTAVAKLEKIKEDNQKDDPGPKPDAYDPATKIDRVTAFFKSNPQYKFLKYEIWPGEYQKQKVWTIDYYYSERGLDGVFVLKHVISYFRQGKIIANSDPISVDEENARPKDESGASSLANGDRKNLSHDPDAAVKPAAADSTTAAGFGFILLGLCVLFYFLPSILAKGRNHHNVGAVFVINLLLGWTLLGWVVALAWAFTTPAPAATVYFQKPDGTLEAVQTPATPKKVPPQIFRL
jgi:Superinfection immunity protein